MKTATLEERFWSKVDRSGSCWIWTGSRQGSHRPHERKYGSFFVEGKRRNAHVVSYEISVGPVPAGMVVMHLCDNPPCVNPSHLKPGTQKQNVWDYHGKM